MIVLPTSKIKATRINPRILVIYSAPKVGKTTLLSQLDDCLILDLEKGSGSVDAMKVELNSMSELGECIKEIRSKNNPYKYLAIDTITKLEDWCEDLATQDYRKSPMGKSFEGKSILELPNGAGYFWLRQAFARVKESIESCAENIIYSGHLRDKMIEKKGKEISAKDLDLTGKIKSITCANADALGYLYRENGELMISFASNDDVICGARPEHLRGQMFQFDWNKIYIK